MLRKLLRKVSEHKPDVAVVDIRMPPTETDDGLRAAIEIRRRLPETGVMVLSQYLDEGYALALVGDGAEGTGYLLKDRVGDVERFADSVRRVGEGGSALDPEVVGRCWVAVAATTASSRSRARPRGARADGGGSLEPGDRPGSS